MHKQLKKALHDLQEEKEMNKCLLENQAIWQQKVTSLESQIRDLAQTKDKVCQWGHRLGVFLDSVSWA